MRLPASLPMLMLLTLTSACAKTPRLVAIAPVPVVIEQPYYPKLPEPPNALTEPVGQPSWMTSASAPKTR